MTNRIQSKEAKKVPKPKSLSKVTHINSFYFSVYLFVPYSQAPVPVAVLVQGGCCIVINVCVMPLSDNREQITRHNLRWIHYPAPAISPPLSDSPAHDQNVSTIVIPGRKGHITSWKVVLQSFILYSAHFLLSRKVTAWALCYVMMLLLPEPRVTLAWREETENIDINRTGRNGHLNKENWNPFPTQTS